jgi:hypothetical protein
MYATKACQEECYQQSVKGKKNQKRRTADSDQMTASGFIQLSADKFGLHKIAQLFYEMHCATSM